MNTPATITGINDYDVSFQASPEAAAPAKKFPAIGDSLAILHQVKRASDDAVLGLQRNDKPVWTKVKQVYLDGSVKCSDGDVWEVVAGQKAMWQTVNPYRGGEEK